MLTVFKDVEKDFRAHYIYFTAQLAFITSYNRKYQPISNWVKAIVDLVLLKTIQIALLVKRKTSLQDLIQALKSMLAPSNVSSKTTIQEEYQAILQ
jgi:hypothetical protein